MNGEMISERELDRLCWLLVSTRNRFHPPDETANECIEVTEDSETEMTDEGRGYERGYHAGMFIARDTHILNLYEYGINVLERANRYIHINRKHGIEFRKEDEPDFYSPVERGAETKAKKNEEDEDLRPDKIEEISWDDPYVPESVELEE
jgi:hypothetical protein